ncbi:MAG: hypothetical protein OXC05_07450 [Halieaceae bacterium]|nr:hypothetical protein [Halieaceae bacterium]
MKTGRDQRPRAYRGRGMGQVHGDPAIPEPSRLWGQHMCDPLSTSARMTGGGAQPTTGYFISLF